VNPGFDPQQVLTFGVAGSPAVHGAPAAVRNGLTQTIDRLRPVPGVAAVSVLFGGLALSGDDPELPYWGDREVPLRLDRTRQFRLRAAFDRNTLLTLRRSIWIADSSWQRSSCGLVWRRSLHSF
jgi:hypothetical protein